VSSRLIPKARYLSREFLDLEYERMWSRVWQVACREEEIPNVGDYVEWSDRDVYSQLPTNEAYKFAINYIISTAGIFPPRN